MEEGDEGGGRGRESGQPDGWYCTTGCLEEGDTAFFIEVSSTSPRDGYVTFSTRQGI